MYSKTLSNSHLYAEESKCIEQKHFVCYSDQPKQPVLPDGRNFGQKAQKGPEKNKVGRKIWWPNFARLWPKMAEKGPGKI